MPSPVEYSTQFEPLPDDSDTLWNVLEILKEKKQRYLVKWEGIDPETGKPWRHSWVPKSDCTDDLIREWKTTKAKKAEKAEKRDPDYAPGKSAKGSKSKTNSSSSTTPRHKPSSTPASLGLRLHSATGNKRGPVVEVIRLKKRPREAHSLGATSTTQVAAEEGTATPVKKKRRLNAVELPLLVVDPDQGGKVNPHRKFSKSPVVISPQVGSDVQEPAYMLGANDPSNCASRVRHQALDPYQTMIHDDGDQMDAYMVDTGPPTILDLMLPERHIKSSRSPSPPDPRALLYPSKTKTIISETQLSTSPSQPRPQRMDTGPANRAPPEAKSSAASALRPIPAISPSTFRSYVSETSAPPPHSQISSIDDFTSPGKNQLNGRGKKRQRESAPFGRRKRPAYSQRQAEEEEEEPARDGLPVHEVVENDDEDVSPHALNETLRLNGQRLADMARVRAQSQMRPKPTKRPLSELLSRRSRSASGDPQSNATGVDDEGSRKNKVVQQDAFHEEIASTSDVARTDCGAVSPAPEFPEESQQSLVDNATEENRREEDASSNNRASGPQSRGAGTTRKDDGSRSDQPASENGGGNKDWSTRDAVASTTGLADAAGITDDGAQPHELGLEHAPDSMPAGLAYLPLSGSANYSLEATGPWTQESAARFACIKSPTKQLDNALGLLNRKSEEILGLRQGLDDQHARAAALAAELEQLRSRLGRYEAASAAQVLEEQPATGTDQLGAALQEIARLQRDGDMLRGLYARASDAHQELLAENRTLTMNNESLRAQATTGVRQAGAFWQARVRTLETELARAQGVVRVLTDQAARTDDDVRRRAALLPVARREAEDAWAAVEGWRDRVGALGQENTRLRMELKEWEDEAMRRRRTAAETEPVAAADELVWVCQWMDEAHRTKCAAVFESREKLREHFYLGH